jgi:DNA-binding LacI/PurR family transcriptional regulator
VLNDHPHVDEDTRALVRKAAADLNYPLKHLRAPRDGYTVLFLRHDDQPDSDFEPTSGIEYAILQGANNVFKSCQVRTYLHNMALTEPYKGDFDLPELSFHAIMLIGGRSTPEFLDAIYRTGMPVVVAGAPVNQPHIGAVYPDYLEGIRQIVTHLADCGRRHIGFINGPNTTGSSLQKYYGYLLGLTLNGLPFVESRVAEMDFSTELSQQRTYELMQRHPELDAIVFASDDAALVGLHVLKSLGKRIPQDVAVTGFHNTKLSLYADPPLTTVAHDMRLVGQQAAARLQQMLNTPDDRTMWRLSVPVNIVVREST